MSARTLRVACIQQDQRRVANEAAFYAEFERALGAAAQDGAELVLFPELNTLPLLSAAPAPLDRAAALARLEAESARWREFVQQLASAHRLTLIAGSHLMRREGALHNTALIALADGRVLVQDKIHITPNEAEAWKVRGGCSVEAIDLGKTRIGVAICYDSEFPELVRRLVDQGIELLLVPFLTDDRAGYLRVRHCCAARAIENQIYVALAGGVGPLENVYNADTYWSQSAILTPSDTMFPPEALAIEAQPNRVQHVVATLDLELIVQARARGTVRNLADRRDDLYRRWRSSQ
jgi:predicted amidohydrolase